MDNQQIIEFIGNHPLLCGAAAVIITLIIGNEILRALRGFKPLTTAQLIKAINQEDALLLDIRDRGKFKAGHIVGAVNLPIDKLTANPNDVKAAPDKTIIIYCENGMDSNRAANMLKKAGFHDLSILKNGISAWAQENLPLETA